MDANKVHFDHKRAIQDLTGGLERMNQVFLLVKESNHSEAEDLCKGVMESLESGLFLLKSADEAEVVSASSGGSLMNRSSETAVRRLQAEDQRPRGRKERRVLNSKKIITDSPFGDGYQWRKYGQKVIRSTQHPRGYYKCSYNDCQAIKQVQQINSGDAPDYVVTFFREHTCNYTELSAPELMPPSPTVGQQIISFKPNESSPRVMDRGEFSTFRSTDHCASSVDTELLQATTLENLDKSPDLDLIAPLSPAGQFFGSDASTYVGLEKPFDPFFPYNGN